MAALVTAAQIVIALGIANVWLLRASRATAYRGGNAQSMEQEFAVYGLSTGFMRLIGAAKLTLAAALVVGIWVPVLVRPAAIAMAALMVGAVLMHVKVKDAPRKALPASTMLLLALFVAICS